MLNKKNLKPYKDMFNIYNLITKINKNYRLFFDEKYRQFLIINIENNYEICLKFNNFSRNIIKELQQTLVQNSKKIFEEIELNNEKLLNKYSKETTNKIYDICSEISKYYSRVNKVLQSDIDKITEV